MNEKESISFDQEKYFKRRRFDVRHYKSLDLADELIQNIIELNYEKYNICYIIQMLKLFYWTNCNDMEDYTYIIKERMNQGITNINSLTKKI